MITKINKLFISVILFFLCFFSFSLVVKATDNNGQKFKTDDGAYSFTVNVTEERALSDNVTYIHDEGKTGNGATDCFMLFSKPNQNEGTKVVSWAIYDDNNSVSSAFSRSKLANIAKDYEKNHKGWKVIGGINGDQYFPIFGTQLHVNGSDLFYNAPYYAMMADGENWFTIDALGRSGQNIVGFKNDGSVDGIEFRQGCESTFRLSVFNENNELLGKYDVNELNPTSKEGSSYTYIYALTNKDQSKDQRNETKSVDVASTNDLYIVEAADKAWVSNTVDFKWYKGNDAKNAFFGKGSISKISKSTTLNSKQFAIETTNEDLLSKLSIGSYVLAQYEMDEDMQACSDGMGWHTLQRLNNVDQNVANSYNSREYPRSVMGITNTGEIMLFASNGKNGQKHGLFAQEVNAICKAYDVKTAFQTDGGGSVTMILRNEKGDFDTVTTGADGADRSIFSGVFFVVRDVDYTVSNDNITSSSLDLNVNINDLGAYSNVQKSYLRLTGIDKTGQPYDKVEEIKDGKVSFKDLAANQSYQYRLCLKVDGQEELKEAFTKGSISTAKNQAKVTKIKLDLINNELKAVVSYSDPHQTIVGNLSISLDGGENWIYLEKGKINIPFTDGDPIGDFLVKARIDINDGNESKNTIYEDVEMTYSVLVFMKSISYSFEQTNKAFWLD